VNDEIFLPFRVARERLGVAKQVRSTLIATSQRAIRTRGLFDRYLGYLEEAERNALETSVAGVWLPMHIAVAHYEACNELGLTHAEQLAIGHEVGDRVHGTFLGMMVRTAKTAGASPWTALNYSQKLFDRLFEGGGGICIVKHGPKEATAEIVGVALLRVPYFRNGFRGLYQAGLQLFCEKVYTTEVARRSSEDVLSVRISWV
jgi:hypothetical protein